MVTKRTWIKLAVLLAISLLAIAYVVFNYVRIPTLLGIGRYQVTVELPAAAGLYANGNVTYQGIEVGRVTDVHLTDSGVDAVLSLDSDIPIPSDVVAQVHSVSAVGEQYVALVPGNAASAPLTGGDTIPVSRTSAPPDINALLNATNQGLQAIPRESLKTVVDESYTAVGGLGPELSRILNSSTSLASGARHNLDSLTTLIDKAGPVLDSQAETADAIHAWAANLADITGQLAANNTSVQNVLDNGGPAAAEVRQLFERLRPTLPILLANLVSVGEVAVTYQPALEQVLVLLPQSVAMAQSLIIPNANTKQDYKGVYLDFQMNMNLPPPCTTGFLPAQQQRVPSLEDYPERPAGDLYCRVPQDSPFNVRGARNLPCMTVPGKRAPTVKMCESDDQYVPLNSGDNWKGDPNATLSGQDIPQMPPESVPSGPVPEAPIAMPGPTPPLATAEYDPATGSYVGPDGTLYTQADLAQQGSEQKAWQSLLLPPPRE